MAGSGFFLEMSKNLPNRISLYKEYKKRLTHWNSTAKKLEEQLQKLLTVIPSKTRVIARVKTFDSYYKKYIKLLKNHKSTEKKAPPPQINDIIGVRIICSFLEDLNTVEELIKRKFKVIEVERKGWGHTIEFAYESIHLLVELTKSDIAELQIRTILQDVWAEAEHELIYKVEFTPFDAPLRRKLAAINASLSMADILFQDVRSYQRKLNGEMGKRRDSFFEKIEKKTDNLLLKEGKNKVTGKSEKAEGNKEEFGVGLSMDDLLLEALSAHNENLFDKAIAIYTLILKMKPDDIVSALIYKHRGMAYFACSDYKKAIADFAKSFEIDPNSYKAAYYEGIVCSVLQRHSQALDAFNRSLKINPYQPYCLFRRGQVFFHLDDYAKALGDCEAAISLEPFEAAQKFKNLVLTKLKM